MDHESKPLAPAPAGSKSEIEHNRGNANGAPDEEPITAVPLYRNMKLIIPLLIIGLGIAGAVWYWYVGTHGFTSTDDAYVDADRVAVSSKMLGRITKLGADEGDTVNVGETLVNLDDSDLKAQEAQANASFLLAQENVKLARVSLDRAQQDYVRAQSQFADKVIPAEQFDHAQKELESARARLAISQAQVSAAEAQDNVIQTQLQNMVIASPMHGVVSKRWALPGDVVQPGQPIFSIYDLENVWVTANLEETKLASLRLGDAVEINVDAYPGRHFNGKVIQIGSNTAGQFSLIPPNNASGNFTKVTQRVPVKIAIETPSATPGDRPVTLLPGMSVEVKVKVG